VHTRRGERAQDISGIEHHFSETQKGPAEWASPSPFSRSPGAILPDQYAGAIGVRTAFHARTSRDFFREFVWQAKGFVFQLSRSSFRPRVFA